MSAAVKILKNMELVNDIGIVIALLIGSVFLAVVSPELGFVTGLLLLLVPGFALIKPLPKLKLGHRGFSFAVLSFVGMPATFRSLSIVNKQDEVEPALLKHDNPEAYLPSLKDKDQELWISEMADIGPERYTAELVRIDKE